jgi:adenylate cyclase
MGSVVPQRTNNLEAYDYFPRGFEECLTITPEAYKSARNFFEGAIVFDPGYAEAYARLALVSLVEYTWQWDDNPHALDRAEQLARRAALLDDSNSDAYAALGSVAILRKRPNEAIAYGERAIELDPNNTLAYLLLSNISGMAGKPEAELAYAQYRKRGHLGLLNSIR